MKESTGLDEVFEILAPGTPLREGLENILRAKTGGLIVIGDNEQVMEYAEGGFAIDSEFSPAALYELAKMDGAIILNSEVTKILRANVHLVTQANIPSWETGIRHRVADRIARQTGAAAIAISQRRNIITIFKGSTKHVVGDTSFILSKANGAIQTLEKYKNVLDKSLNKLSILELEDAVTLYYVAEVVQKLEMVLMVMEEIENYIKQLGNEGRLISMQLVELTKGIEKEGEMLLRDYYRNGEEERSVRNILMTLEEYREEDKLDLLAISKALGYGGSLSSLDLEVTPKGYRLLSKLPRLPIKVIENLTSSFNDLPAILRAGVEELNEVDGIGEVRAKAIKEGLQNLREQLLLDPHFYYS